MKLQSILFDEYSDSIGRTSALLLATSPATARWAFAEHQIHRMILRFGAEGSASIVHGITRPDATSFVAYAYEGNTVLFNGQTISSDDLVVTAPAADFTFASKKPVKQWISLTVPNKLVSDMLS